MNAESAVEAIMRATAGNPALWWSQWTAPYSVAIVGVRVDPSVGVLDIVISPGWDDPDVPAVPVGEPAPVYMLTDEEHAALENRTAPLPGDVVKPKALPDATHGR